MFICIYGLAWKMTLEKKQKQKLMLTSVYYTCGSMQGIYIHRTESIMKEKQGQGNTRINPLVESLLLKSIEIRAEWMWSTGK